MGSESDGNTMSDHSWSESLARYEETSASSSSSQSTESTLGSDEDADLVDQIRSNRMAEIELEEGSVNSKVLCWIHRNIKTLTYKSIDEIIKVMRSEGHDTLPMSCKTLLKINNVNSDTQLMLSTKDTFGKYKYFKIEKSLTNIIDSKVFLEPIIKVVIHVDGMEIFRNSKKGFWSIMGKIFTDKYDTRPFLIALYHGHSKPKSVNEYLFDFIEEANLLMTQGIEINDKQYAFEIVGFTCDMPARAYIKCCKGHMGFFSCERCECEGVTVNRKRVFPETNSCKRNYESFKTKVQPQHHCGNEDSPLLKLKGFDPVKSVFLDKMHGLDLGVSKFFVDKFINGGRYFDIGKNNMKILQQLLIIISKDIPMEFQRNTFDMSALSTWKATQYAFFLSYAAGLFLYYVLKTDRYKHFMLLFTACRILCSEEYAVLQVDYAEKILKVFVELMPTYYGPDCQVMNIHNLIHISGDVRSMNTSLSKFSAYDFENTLGFMGRLVKMTKHPIAQITRKLHSLQIASSISVTTRFPFVYRVRNAKDKTFISISEELNDKVQIEYIKLKDFTITTAHPNNTILTKDKKILRIYEIFSLDPNVRLKESIILKGKEFALNEDLFDYPVPSRHIGIYKVDQLKRRSIQIPATACANKCILTTFKKKTVAITLLHV